MSEPQEDARQASPAEEMPSPPKGKTTRSTSLGVYDRPQHSLLTEIEVIAIVLTAIWLAGAAIFFFFLGNIFAEDAEANRGLRILMTTLALFMPVAMIWVAATAARASRVMREESQRLQAAIDAIRQSYIAQQQGHHLRTERSMARKLDEIAATARKTETALATFQSRRDAAAPSRAAATPSAPSEEQPVLALGTPASDMGPVLATEDFIRALNFPETAEDESGFTSLRRAMRDRQAKQLIQAAQDVLTLMSQDGIYMDDLRPDRARPEVWRQFAAGARGRAIAALGGIHDRSSLALTQARMKTDPIFRDAAHHFLRLFDRTFASFADQASDGEISALADTRTARAFMLLARCAGTFD